MVAAGLAFSVLAAGCGAGADATGADATGASGPPETATTPAASSGAFRGFPVGHAFGKPKVTLTDTAGKPYDVAKRTKGKVLLLYYGFTHCDDTCPAAMADVAQALRDSPAQVRRDVRVVFVTTDPERDSPARLRHWLDKFDPHFVGLTGSKESLAKAYHAVGLPKPVKVPTSGGGYDVVHGADVYAYSLDGRAHLAYGPDAAPKQIAHDLPLLAAGKQPPPPSVSELEASGGEGSVGAVRVATAFIPQPRRGQPPIVEMTLGNTASSRDTLIGVRTSAGGKAVLVDGHGHRRGPLHLAAVPDGVVVLAASRAHLEIVGRDDDAPPLRKGQLVKVTMTFAHAGRGSVTVPVTGPGGPGS